MSLHDFREFQKDFVQYLISQNYNPDNIVLDFEIGTVAKRRVDVAIIDPSSLKPIALFGLVRYAKKIKSEYDFLHPLKKKYDVEIFLVLQEGKDKDFKIYRTLTKTIIDQNLSGRAIEKVDLSMSSEPEELPSYKTLLNIARSSYLRKAEDNRKQTIDLFSKISWGLASLIAIVLIIDLSGFIKVSSTHLTLIALFSAFVLIPFMSKLKILGVEFERYFKERIEDEKRKIK